MLEELDKSGVTQAIPIDELKEQVQEGEGVFSPMALRGRWKIILIIDHKSDRTECILLFRNLPYIQYI